MIWLVGTIHVIVCLILIGVVLLQQGKSADLAGAFGGQGSQTAFGPRGAANPSSREGFKPASLSATRPMSNAPDLQFGS